MKRYGILKPVGLKAPCGEIEETCRRAHLYRRCGLRPSHLIIPLDSGSGRTTFLEYMTSRFQEAGVMDFSSGLDDYVEVVFDGTLPQVRQAFYEIDSAAVYANEYTGIVSMDISSIASHMGETQFASFLTNCRKVCGHACVVFFVHSVPSRNEEKLIEKLCENVDNIKRLDVEPYKSGEIAELTLRGIADHGICVRNEEAFLARLTGLITEFGISTVKGANAVAASLVEYADFSEFTPVVDESSLDSMIADWHTDPERRSRK